MTIYTYNCGDDARGPARAATIRAETQVYRLAMCGGGDARTVPAHIPVRELAKSGTRSAESRVERRPTSIRRLASARPRRRTVALRVWAFRDRPVYTYAGEREPGDVYADGHGDSGPSARVPRLLVARRLLQPVTER